MAEYVCTNNTEEIINRFKRIDYKELTDSFRNAIEQSLNILKDATQREMQGSGVNVHGKIRKGGTTYSSLVEGVISETSLDGTKGRVRVAPATKKDYPISHEGSFALKWYELGTSERVRKNGGKTGSIRGYNWFGSAFNSTKNDVNKSLEENINKIILRIWRQ